MIAPLLGFAFLCACLILVFLPLRIWEGLRTGAPESGDVGTPARPPAAMSSALLAEVTRARSEETIARAAWVGLPLLFVLALIPFGGVYAAASGERALVPLDLDWGMQAVLAGLTCAAFGAVAARSREGESPSARPLLRVAVLVSAFALSWVGIFMLASSLRPVEIVRFQDQVIPLLGLPLPAWGALLQPLALAIHLLGLVALRPVPPSESSRLIEETLALPLLAMLTVTLFFGGGSLPYLTGDALVALLPASVATPVAALVHVAAFLAKSALLFVVWLRVRDRLPRFTDTRALALAWKLLIPLALLNLLATGALILRSVEVNPA